MILFHHFQLKWGLYSVVKTYLQNSQRTNKSNQNYLKLIGKNCKNNETAIEPIIVL